MRHHFCAEYENCKIRPLRHEDIELLRIWRNNQALSKYLTPVGEITPEMQEEWFIRNQADENIVTFAVEETKQFKRMIGSVSLYDFQDSAAGRLAEVGKSMIGDDEARGKSLGFLSELMADYIGFQRLNLALIIARIHENNAASMKRAKRLGYTIIGSHPFVDGCREIDMNTTKAQFEQCHEFLPQIRIFEE